MVFSIQVSCERKPFLIWVARSIRPGIHIRQPFGLSLC